MKIKVLSSCQTNARDFFTAIRESECQAVIDVRLNNSSQLAGFTKGTDLEFLVPELTKAKYIHDLRFAPPAELLKNYLIGEMDYLCFKEAYLKAIEERGGKKMFMNSYKMYSSIVLIGAGTKKRHSHSEALKDYLEDK
jgi:uncharacterized protein YeaO (DUF488 family)